MGIPWHHYGVQMRGARTVFLLLFWTFLSGSVWAQVEVKEEIERDFPLRSLGELHITNLRGGVVVQGWPQDRLRVKGQRVAKADTKEDAKKLFSALDITFRQNGKDVELSADYGKGLDIAARIRERKAPRTRMDFTVQAPAGVILKIWTIDGAVTVKNWGAAVDIRTSSGEITVDSVRTGGVNVICPSCPVSIHAVHGPVRCMGGSGKISLSELYGSQVYVESDSGAEEVHKISGDQLYVSKSGAIIGDHLDGRVEFHANSGNVELRDIQGFLSGRSESGNILAGLLEWKFMDRALIESVIGNIFLTLPSDFAGELDLWSLQGRVVTDFTVESPRAGADPIRGNRVRGMVSHGDDQFKVMTQKGEIHLQKGH